MKQLIIIKQSVTLLGYLMTKILIGVPTLNGSERLERCIRALIHNTNFSKFDTKILIADDGSTDENIILNKNVVHNLSTDYYPIQMLYGQGRTGIASTWNRLTKHFGDWPDIVVLINDDVEVVKDWLDALVFSLVNNPKIGMLGLNTYCGLTDGQLTVNPPIVDYIESNILLGNGMLVSAHGPIFGFRKAVYNEIGGFDERYFCFYEEVDFGVALRYNGYINAMLSYPICFHMGGATNSEPKNLNAQQCMSESKQKFHAKWKLSLDELRNIFKIDGEKVRRHDFVNVEWNTQIKNWTD